MADWSQVTLQMMLPSDPEDGDVVVLHYADGVWKTRTMSDLKVGSYYPDGKAVKTIEVKENFSA